MTLVAPDNCIRRIKYIDCVGACPVGCFYEGEIMLAIPLNAPTAGFANPNARRRPSFPTPRPGLDDRRALKHGYFSPGPGLGD